MLPVAGAFLDEYMTPHVPGMCFMNNSPLKMCPRPDDSVCRKREHRSCRQKASKVFSLSTYEGTRQNVAFSAITFALVQKGRNFIVE